MDILNKTMHRMLLEKLLKNHANFIRGNILDVGSHNRRYDNLFAGKMTAVDKVPCPEKDMLFGDIEAGLNFVDSSFDGIICIEVLEYLEKYEYAISEIYRLLKVGGTAIVSIPFMYHEHSDKLRYTKDFLSSKLNIFSEVECVPFGNGWVIIWDILRKKVIFHKNRLIKYLLFLLLLPLLGLINLLHLDRKEDIYYSGLFFIIKK